MKLFLSSGEVVQFVLSPDGSENPAEGLCGSLVATLQRTAGVC